MVQFFDIMRKPMKDPGLGQKFETESSRVINKDGSFNVKKVGFGYSVKNTYQVLIKMSWGSFTLCVLLSMILINIAFTLCYFIIGINELKGIVATNNVSEFLQVYFFSFQTFTTVGYGSISPVGNMAGLLTSLEATIGLISFALVTSVLYGRFSRPTARFKYSKNALIAPYEDGWSLQFRIANWRQSQIIELDANVILVFTEKFKEKFERKFYDLNLETNHILFLPLNWTLVHPINEDSPLYGMTKHEFKNADVEILIQIKGFDDTFSQVVHSRYSYTAEEIVWGGKFIRPFYVNESRETILDASLIDKYDSMTYEGPLIKN